MRASGLSGVRPRILFDHPCEQAPALTVVLADWARRESEHTLNSLASQTVPRSQYEVIWVEYYDRSAADVRRPMEEADRTGCHAVVDRWIMLNVAAHVPYHASVIYNAGLVAARGTLVALCEADAIVRPTFVQAILEAFARESPGTVLRFDMVGDQSRGAAGVVNVDDPGHVRDYDACLAAPRADLLSVGGADEHLEYGGGCRGLCELSWRLVNAGRREVWHPSEFLYKAWHPGSGGYDDHPGRQGGRKVSPAALAIRRTGRVFPLVENGAVRSLRLNGSAELPLDERIGQLFDEEALTGWVLEEVEPAPAQIAGPLHEAPSATTAARDRNGRAPSTDATALATSGWALHHRGLYEDALRAFSDALRVDAAHEGALRGRGWAHLQLFDLDSTIRDFTAAVQTNPSDTNARQDAFRGRAWAHLHRGAYYASLNDFLTALTSADVSDRNTLQDVCRGLGWLHCRLGKFDRAGEWFENAIAFIDPGNPEALNDARKGRDEALAGLSATRDASTGLASALTPESLQPDRAYGDRAAGGATPRLLARLGWAYYRNRQYSRALVCFDKALDLDGRYQDALVGRGWTLLLLRRLEEATRDFESALDAADTRGRDRRQEILRGRAWAYYHAGSVKEAVRDFSEALRHTEADDKPMIDEILRGRSRAYYRAGDLRQALEDAVRRQGLLPSAGSWRHPVLRLQLMGASFKQALKGMLR